MTDIWIPRSARAAFVCRGCGEEFKETEQQAFERHVIGCSANEEAQHNRHVQNEEHRVVFGAEDREYETWARENPEAWMRERGMSPTGLYEAARKQARISAQNIRERAGRLRDFLSRRSVRRKG